MADQIQAAELPAELVARIEIAAREGYAFWKANCTEEMQAAGLALHAKFMADPEFGAQEMARTAEMWSTADANADGLLDEAEFGVFRAAQLAHAASSGNFS